MTHLFPPGHLNINDIVSLLNFTLSNNYFVFSDKIYKQVHGCVMGSPVSPVVANLCMEEIEEFAINASPVTPKIWKRYVDDSFCIIKKNGVTAFHDTLNSIDTNISFTIEHECNGKISFLDTSVSPQAAQALSMNHTSNTIWHQIIRVYKGFSRR